MDWKFTWEALIVLSVGYALLRILGKKTVGEMTGVRNHHFARNGFYDWSCRIRLWAF